MRQGFKDFFLHSKGQLVGDANIREKYYCGDDPLDLISRDLFVEFCQARREQAVNCMNEFDRLDANLRMLQMKIHSTEQEEKKVTGKTHVDFATKLWSRIPHKNRSIMSVTPTETCEYCNKQTKQAAECCLCSGIHCPTCSGGMIPVKTSSGNQDFPVCIPCRNVYDRHKIIQDRKDAIENAEQHPLVKNRAILDEIEQCIIAALPKYEEIVTAIKKQTFPPTVEIMPDVIQYVKKAKKYETVLDTFCENYQIGLEKVKKLQCLNSEKDKRLQSRFVQAKIQVYKKYYTPFRVLKAELKQKTPKLIRKQEVVVKETKPEKIVQPPIIASIEPAFLPTEGGDIAVHGSFFHPTAKVYVNGLEVNTVQINSDTLYAQVPGYPISGSIPLFVRNPDADSDNITLFYSDQSDSDLKLSIEEDTLQEASSFNLTPGYKGIGADSYKPISAVSTKQPKNTRVWGPVTTTQEKQEKQEEQEEKVEIILHNFKDIYKRSDPIISTITPILSPPSGIPITITGYRFAKQVKVGIGPIVLDDLTTSYSKTGNKIECTIHCETPALPEGIYSVTVENPKGSKTTMGNVLLYIPHKKWLSITEQPHQNDQNISKIPNRRVWG